MNIGQQVYFSEDEHPFLVRARDVRFVVLTRDIVRPGDEELFTDFATEEFEEDYMVKSMAEGMKVYTIIDFLRGVRDPNNLIMDDYDYKTDEDVARVLADLQSEKIEVTWRTSRFVPINIVKVV